MVKSKKVFCIVNIAFLVLALGASGFFAWQVYLVFNNHQTSNIFLYVGIATAVLSLVCIILFAIYFAKFKKPVNIEENTEEVNNNQEQSQEVVIEPQEELSEEQQVEQPTNDNQDEEQVDAPKQKPPVPPKQPKRPPKIKKEEDNTQQEQPKNEIIKEKIKVKPVIAPKIVVPQKPEIKNEKPKQGEEFKKPPLPPKLPKAPQKPLKKPPQKPNI